MESVRVFRLVLGFLIPITHKEFPRKSASSSEQPRIWLSHRRITFHWFLLLVFGNCAGWDCGEHKWVDGYNPVGALPISKCTAVT